MLYLDKIPASQQAQFSQKVTELAGLMKISPDLLMWIMNYETAGTMRPDIENKYGCVGLIQFCASARADLGISKATLKSLTHVQQMDWVKKYFIELANVQSKNLKGLADIYLLWLGPAYINPYGYTEPLPFTQTQKDANKQFKDEAGNITKKSITEYFLQKYPELKNLSGGTPGGSTGSNAAGSSWDNILGQSYLMYTFLGLGAAYVLFKKDE